MVYRSCNHDDNISARLQKNGDQVPGNQSRDEIQQLAEKSVNRNTIKTKKTVWMWATNQTILTTMF